MLRIAAGATISQGVIGLLRWTLVDAVGLNWLVPGDNSFRSYAVVAGHSKCDPIRQINRLINT